MENKKIIIIGGGPGGYETAIEAAKLGADVTVIEKRKLGGTCLNEGCIPTKAIYSSAAAYKMINHANDYGLSVDGVAVDYKTVIDRKNKIVDELNKGIHNLLKKHKVNIVKGEAHLIDKHTVKIVGRDKIYTGDYILIAIGSSPKVPTIEGVEQVDGIITSKELLDLKVLPKRLVVVGGGVIGLEFASILNAFGVEVTVIEYMPNILPTIDSGISKRMKSFLKKDGINIINNAKVESFKKFESSIEIIYEDKKGKQIVYGDKVLVSVGRRGNIESLNLSDIGIETNDHFIITNEYYQTNIDNIYAIGDINGKWLLAHAASHQGFSVINELLLDKPIKEKVVPSVIFTFPEIATVGISEDEAKAKGLAYKVSKAMYSANGKAKAMGKTDGFIKVLVDEDDKLLGVHIIGEHGADIIHEATVAMANNISVNDLKETIHAHPTLSEIFYEAIREV